MEGIPSPHLATEWEKACAAAEALEKKGQGFASGASSGHPGSLRGSLPGGAEVELQLRA